MYTQENTLTRLTNQQILNKFEGQVTLSLIRD